MATRYSKERGDGTIGYYDSVEEMDADVLEPPSIFAFDADFAFTGFFACLVIACIAVFFFGVGEALPKWARFASVFIAAGAGSYVIGRIGQLLVYVLFFALVISITVGIVSLIWHYA